MNKPVTTTVRDSISSNLNATEAMNETQATIRSVLGFLQRRMWLILATAAIILVLATIFTLTLKPVYVGTTLIMVDTNKKDVLTQADQSSDFSADSARVDSEVELVNSESTLLRAIHALDLTSSSEYTYHVPWQDLVMNFLKIRPVSIPDANTLLKNAVDQLHGSIDVQRVGLTYIIAINAHSRSPEAAAAISNAVAAAYIQDQLDAKIASTLDARNAIGRQVPQANAAVAASEASLDQFYADSLPAIAASAGNIQLTKLSSQLSATTNEKSRLVTLVADASAGAEAREWDKVVAALKSDTLSKLNDQRQALERSLAGTKDQVAATDLRGQLTALDSQLDSATKAAISSLQSRVSSDDSTSNDLRGQIGDALRNANLPADVVTHLYTLQQDQNNATDNYKLLLTRRTSLEMNANLQLADSRIVSPATAPNAAAFPNLRLIVSLTAVAALGVGLGLAFLYENFIGGFTSEQQLGSILGATVITAVPWQRGNGKSGQNGGASLANNLIDAPLSVYSETIRRIRVRLDLSLRDRQVPDWGDRARGSVVMVTSTAPGEGKTTISLALARAFALTGRKTILIDCDLRKPSVHRQVGLETSGWLTTYLTMGNRGIDMSALTVADPLSAASLALGGRRSEAATDQLVGSDAFFQLIEAAARVFDVVVIDTPPVGPVVDGIYLAQHADVIAFVVKAGSTSQPDARKALQAISEAKRPDVETLLVLNQHNERRSAYYNRYRGYYSD